MRQLRRPSAAPTAASTGLAVAVAAALASGGCYGARTEPTPMAADPFDGGPAPDDCRPPECFERDLVWSGADGTPTTVDVLMVIDDSSSMSEEQAALRDAVPRFVGALATGDLERSRPDAEGHGVRDFDPPESIHFGVVSTDMGTGGFAHRTCIEPLLGRDGRLETRGNRAGDATLTCRPTYDRFLTLDNEDRATCVPDGSGTASPDCDAAIESLACVSALGAEGCGFEQPLEAMLKALMPDTPACVAPYCDFFRGTRGHGANPAVNGGFQREGSLLVILHLTDDDDCSAADPDLFNPRTPLYFGNLNLRCGLYPAALHPVDRYVDGLLSLVPAPSRLLFAAVAGVPPDLARSTRRADGSQDFDTLLASPALVLEPNVDNTAFVRACRSDNGEAAPSPRLVRVARALDRRGAGAVVGSICEPDLRPVIDAVLSRLAAQLQGVCLPEDFPSDEAGFVPCRLRERLPVGERCRSVPGRTRVALEGEREVCDVAQRTAGSDAPGWFYDDGDAARARCGDANPRRIAFVEGAEPRVGSELRIECASD